jgi:hypothetical protein
MPWEFDVPKGSRPLNLGDELTLERVEMNARICRQFPCSTEFYQAQVELTRQQFQHSRV